MPGPLDPANYMLPQQPFHPCMFPQASQNSSFQAVSNPYDCELDGVSIVGCSGQNVCDLLRSTQINDPLTALRQTLIWSHIAPTAPDTLASYPYIDSDPFILKSCPHIYFAGNCSSFATAMHEMDNKKTRLICIPSFAQTQSVVLVDLGSLECREIVFKVDND